MTLNIVNKQASYFSRWLMLPAFSVLVSCGGGANNNTAETKEISGAVFAAEVSDARCEVKDSAGNTTGQPFVTDAKGEFVFTLPTSVSTSTFSIICDGGDFEDEATGESTIAGEMAAYISQGIHDGNYSVQITPSSTIVHHLILEHDKSPETATAHFKAAFGYEPDLVNKPHNATVDFDGDVTTQLDHRRSGLRAATFSQLTKDLGLSAADQFSLYQSLAKDLADGALDGRNVNGFLVLQNTKNNEEKMLNEGIKNQFNQALVNFRESGKDKSSLKNSEIGVLVFADHSMTENYQIKYIPSMHGAVNGKTEFTLAVSDVEGEAQTGLTIMIQPTMNMSGKTHRTAFQKQCVEDTGGEYKCTVYYIMPSVMMNGMSMGYWALNVMIEGEVTETATFYPTVKMAMGDTVQVKLKGVNDKISAMSSQNNEAMYLKAQTYMAMAENEESRTYFIFKEDLMRVNGNYDFKMFIAAKESMMSFPAISTGAILNQGHMNNTLTLTDISVQVSTDAITWLDATEKNTEGHWEVAGIEGLVDDEDNILYVKLVINEEQKTTDGKIADLDFSNMEETNQFAQFVIKLNGSSMSM